LVLSVAVVVGGVVVEDSVEVVFILGVEESGGCESVDDGGGGCETVDDGDGRYETVDDGGCGCETVDAVSGGCETVGDVECGFVKDADVG